MYWYACHNMLIAAWLDNNVFDRFILHRWIRLIWNAQQSRIHYGMNKHIWMLENKLSRFGQCSTLRFLCSCFMIMPKYATTVATSVREKNKILLNFKRYIGTLEHICIHLIWYKQFGGKNYSQTYIWFFFAYFIQW